MAFCPNCGANVQDRFCPNCGADTGVQQQAYQAYQPPVVPTPDYDEARDAQENKTMAILAYIIFFIPLITGDHKKSPFVKFHTNQGTVLWLAMLAWGIVSAILNAIFYAISWQLWSIMSLIFGLLWLVPGIFAILGIISAVQGNMKPLPLIGKIVIIK